MADTLESEPQPIDAPMTAVAAFLVLEVAEGEEAISTARSVLAGTDDLIKDVRIRANGRPFTCNVGISDNVWDRLTGGRLKPKDLRPFKEFKGSKHTAVATPGDLLYHIRAETTDLVIEFEKLVLEAFGDSVSTVDDVAGFRYFDGRDLLEFIDGTANPDGLSLPAATLIGDEDPEYAGGSYVTIQKYLHDLGAWRKESTETQEQIIGRTKPDNIELPDAGVDQQKSHKTLCTIADDAGEHAILRDNMPFAIPGEGLYGTFFIGYARHLWVTEKMMERMFIGDPPPLHDRILDFSKAVSGVTLFVPPRAFLKSLGDSVTSPARHRAVG